MNRASADCKTTKRHFSHFKGLHFAEGSLESLEAMFSFAFRYRLLLQASYLILFYFLSCRFSSSTTLCDFMKRARETLTGLLDFCLGRTELKKKLADAGKRLNFSLYLSFVVLSGTLDLIPADPTTPFEQFVTECSPALFLNFLVHNERPCFENLRSQAAVENIWGDTSAFERAHLIPLSRDCGMEWIDVFALLLLSHNTEENAKILLFGFLAANGKRSPYSGLLHNAINFLGLPNQFEHLDKSSSVLFVPLLTAKDILNWSGEPYKCLIIAKDEIVMKDLGFLAAAQGASSDYFCEMDSHSEEVYQGCEELKKLLLMIIMFVKAKELKKPDTSAKTKKCKILREFLSSPTLLSIPWFDVRKAPSMVVVCLNFIGTEIEYPNRRGRSHHRSCPHPFLLVLRSFNSYFNMLDAMHSWTAWEQHLAEPSREVLRQTPLVLFPSCRDCNLHAPDCLYCMARSIYLEPEAYPGLSDAEYEAAQAVLKLPQVADDDVDLVEGVRIRASSSDKGERKGSDGGSAATGSSEETATAQSD